MKQTGQLPQSLAIVDSVIVRAHGGGEKTGPSPVDRRKPGTKLTLMVDRDGAPLAIRVAGANASDHTQLLPTAVRALGGGGEATGPSPVDRRKRGSKHTLLVDRSGVPLAIRTAKAMQTTRRRSCPSCSTSRRSAHRSPPDHLKNLPLN